MSSSKMIGTMMNRVMSAVESISLQPLEQRIVTTRIGRSKARIRKKRQKSYIGSGGVTTVMRLSLMSMSLLDAGLSNLLTEMRILRR